MNKHSLLLVMKWLDDKYSVSKEELEENKRAAYTTAYAAYTTAYAAHAAYAAYAAEADAEAYAKDYAACAAHAAHAAEAYAAAEAADYAEVAAADYWVNKYFKESGEDKNEYLEELSK